MVALLVGLAAFVYWPTLDNGYIWDDDYYVTKNDTLHTLGGLSAIWINFGATPQYYPLVHSSYWIENHLWGLDPRGYHVVNLLLHALAAVLVWRLLMRLFVPGAWFGAALFAVHPIEVESVAWITERKNVLSAVFALGALLAYLRFWPPGALAADAKNRVPTSWAWWFLSLGLYVAALLSKTVTASVPAVLLVIYWWKNGRLTWSLTARLIPFFTIGLGLASLTAYLEKYRVGAIGAAWEQTPIERILIAGRAVWFYAAKLAWPYPLVFFYPRWNIDARMWWQYLYPVAAFVLLVVLWLARGRTGRGPLAAALIFGGVLVPALGFFNVYPFLFSFVADHFQYHAGIALLALAAASITVAVEKVGFKPMAKSLVAAALILTLAIVAHSRTYTYRDLTTLYEDTIALNPGSWPAHHNLGNVLEKQGKVEEAIGHYRAALKNNPEHAPLRISLAKALCTIGMYDEAAAQTRQAMATGLVSADAADAHTILGVVLIHQQDPAQAIEQLRKALALNPRQPNARSILGTILAGNGDLDGGIEQLQESASIDPTQSNVHYALGMLLSRAGRFSEAVNHLRIAAQLAPSNPAYQRDLVDALCNSAIGLLKQGNFADAEKQIRESLEIHPQNITGRNLLGAVLAQYGRTQEAIAEFEAVLRVEPNNPLALENLRNLRSEQKQK